MNFSKKLTAITTAVALVGSFNPNVSAQEYFQSHLGGFGYEESREAASMVPAIVLGTAALATIVAVALQDSHHGHGIHN